jgi:hypothetical protein
MKQGLSDVLLFGFLSLRLVLKSNSPQFLPMKAGIDDVLLFVIPFFVFGLKSIFNSPTISTPIKARDCGVCCDFLSLCWS